MTTNQGFKSVVFAPGAHPDFYYHLFQTLKREMERRASGTTFLEISGRQFAEIAVPQPPMPEQRRIASILDALDMEIRSSQRMLAKLRAVERGVVHDLIQQRKPNCTLSWGLAGSPANGIYKPASMIGRGTLLVGQTAFTEDRRVDSALARRAVVTASERGRFGLRVGDVLVSRVFATLDGVGQPALVQDLGEPAVFESNMMRLRCDQSKADPLFVFYSLTTPRTRGYIVRHANLSNQASISQGVLTELPVWLPGLNEQRGVCDAIVRVKARIDREHAFVEKLLAEREGIASDLLSARVRVPAETAA